MPSQNRYLIARLSALGDCIHTLPVACALKAREPDCFVAWVVEKGTASLLTGHPCIDRLVVVPRGWLRSPWRVWELRGELLSLGCRTALDPQSLTKSAFAAWLSGAARRIGFGGAHGRELSTWLNTELVAGSHNVSEQSKPLHVVDRYLSLLKPLGITAPRVEFRLPEPPTAADAVEAAIRERGLEPGFAVLNPGAGWPSKLWPPESFAEVARHLGETHGLPSLVVWAGDEERGWAEQIAAGSRGQAAIAPNTTLPELAALLRRARLFVGSDTGPLHLAAAVGTPCIGLYGPTLPAECGPYGAGNIALQVEHLAGTCRERRAADNGAMRAIGPEMVAEACDRILRATPSPTLSHPTRPMALPRVA